MTAAKHTPGPWTAGFSTSFPQEWTIYESEERGGDAICSVARGFGNNETGGYDPDPTNEPNARLIAAAPELLEALRHAKTVLGMAADGAMTRPHLDAAWTVIEAAIAKAVPR